MALGQISEKRVETNVYLCFDMNHSEVKLRIAERHDIPAMHALVRELAIYEKAEEQHTVTVEQMAEDGFGPEPHFDAFVAEVDRSRGHGDVLSEVFDLEGAHLAFGRHRGARVDARSRHWSHAF